MHNTAQCLEYGLRSEVFRGYKVDEMPLSVFLLSVWISVNISSESWVGWKRTFWIMSKTSWSISWRLPASNYIYDQSAKQDFSYARSVVYLLLALKIQPAHGPPPRKRRGQRGFGGALDTLWARSAQSPRRKTPQRRSRHCHRL